jgi:N-acetylneuraminic acid mutarotase
MDRMVSGSRDPQTLRELFEALGDDPTMVAETLARESLVDRLIRNWYATDNRFHGDARAKAQAALAACATTDCLRTMGGMYSETTWRLDGDGRQDTDRVVPDPAIVLGIDDWKRHLERWAVDLGGTAGQIPISRWSRLEETRDAFYVMAVLRLRDDEAVTARITWPKRSFEAWWSVERDALPTSIKRPLGSFTLASPSLATCTNDTWAPTRVVVPDPRFSPTVVWTGTEMIVWGGDAGENNSTSVYVGTGGRYNPSTDTWTVTSTGANVPSKRKLHTAVWTGTEMIVWGGWNGSVDLGDGARYDPASDTWTPLLGGNAAFPRRGHSAVWTGTQMIIWGGTDGPYYNTGGRYDPATSIWTATSTGPNVPSARVSHTAVWTGKAMIVWGGSDPAIADTGGRYDPVTNVWSPTSTGVNVPSARSSHTAVWTGTEMIVWGGGTNTGGRYDPSTDSWTSTSTGANVPLSRSYHTAVWTGSEMVIWGGAQSVGPAATGGRYNPVTNAWRRTSVGTNVPSGREYHVAVWTGNEMLVWGGGWSSATNTGGRYDPVSDSWIATSTGGEVPAARRQHTAVWTGAEMIVWGGDDGAGSINTGGRYNPSTDSSTPTSVKTGVPSARLLHHAVWTGTHMIVWGGYDSASVTTFNTGGRYNPLTDSWLPTSTEANVPAGRYDYSAVWTGSEMIVWGGSTSTSYANSGARYDPKSDLWRPTSTGLNVPSVRTGNTAVWTGNEMIVWGGYGFDDRGYGTGLNTGGRYNPVTDTWTPTSTGTNVPVGRTSHAGVWTGSEMIVWGGTSGFDITNTGARYKPTDDSWLATSTGPNVPVARNRFTSVWTGKEMIVWGGAGCSTCFLNIGGRYDPTTDTWTATSTGSGVPSGRYLHTAVWTGNEMIVWGGMPTTSSGGLYCACPNGRMYYRDADGDGYGDTGTAVPSCDGTAPPGSVSIGLDCDDRDPSIHPGVTETCNGRDDDCNGFVDESAATEDADGDSVHDLCDDCPLAWNPTQSDFDHDGEGDICDLNDGLIYIYSTDKNYREWQGESGFTSWNSYRGSLAVLRVTGQYTQAPGSNPLATRDCGLTDPYVSDATELGPGEVAFNLVTGVAGGVESGLGTNSAGAPRPNANPCP